MPLSVVVLEPEGSRESNVFVFRLLTRSKLAHQQLNAQLKILNYRLRDVTNNAHPRRVKY